MESAGICISGTLLCQARENDLYHHCSTFTDMMFMRRLNRDTVGIIARSVDDAARVLGAVTGADAADPQTQLVINQTQPDDWTYFLDRNGLRGARIGVLRSFAKAADSEVAPLFQAALRDLAALGDLS